MENLTQLMQVFSNFGIVGVLVVLWIIDGRKAKSLEHIIQNQESHIKRYEELARDLKDVVMLNTQAITRMEERLGVLINFAPKRKRMEAISNG